jgi:hypothetical protein
LQFLVEFPGEKTATVALVAKSVRFVRSRDGRGFQETSAFSEHEGIASSAVDTGTTALRFFHWRIVTVEFLGLQRPSTWELAVVQPFNAVVAVVPIVPGSDRLGRQDRRNHHQNGGNQKHFVVLGGRHFHKLFLNEIII